MANIVPSIPTPCNSEVNKYLNQWANTNKYVCYENSLNDLFRKTYPNNKKIEEILTKVSSLNNLYSTNTFSPYDVAEHISKISNIDDRLQKGDSSLVWEIANVKIGGKKKIFYSFATKYCSFHNPDAYPIYDSYIEKVLCYFQKNNSFVNGKFIKKNLKNYNYFIKILDNFKNKYGLNNHKTKELDRYLWLLGKKYF